jgi:hypothetical protein
MHLAGPETFSSKQDEIHAQSIDDINGNEMCYQVYWRDATYCCVFQAPFTPQKYVEKGA